MDKKEYLKNRFMRDFLQYSLLQDVVLRMLNLQTSAVDVANLYKICKNG